MVKRVAMCPINAQPCGDGSVPFVLVPSLPICKQLGMKSQMGQLGMLSSGL